MSRAKKPDEPDLLQTLRKSILDVLNDKDTKAVDKRWALELAAKLVLIEAKIGDGNSGGNFFGN